MRFALFLMHVVVAPPPAGLTLATPTSETQEFNFEYPPLQPGPTPVSAQLVMFTEAWTVAANPLLCGVKGGEIQQLACAVPFSGTGGQMEAYAILS